MEEDEEGKLAGAMDALEALGVAVSASFVSRSTLI
jgi:hypothetical protein